MTRGQLAQRPGPRAGLATGTYGLWRARVSGLLLDERPGLGEDLAL